MPYLIDGHNLIPKVPGLSLRSMDDEIELIQKLQEFCRRSGKKVEVYFDNAPAGQARTQSFGRVKAHFVRSGRTADDAIISRLRNLGRSAQNWTVVSSDRQVQAGARGLRAKVVSSNEFAGFLITHQLDDGSDSATGADLTLNSAEIDEWLALFENGGDGKSDA